MGIFPEGNNSGSSSYWPFCGNPDLLILEEPTTGMDVDSRRTTWTHIRSFVSRGGGVLLTTHYLEKADALANRTVVIDKARIKAAGTREQIKRHAASKKGSAALPRLLQWSFRRSSAWLPSG